MMKSSFEQALQKSTPWHILNMNFDEERVVLIACVDGLKGFPEDIAAVFPETEFQLYVIHQIRNSLS